MNPQKFTVFCIKKKQSQLNEKNKIIFIEKKKLQISQHFFLHGNG